MTLERMHAARQPDQAFGTDRCAALKRARIPGTIGGHGETSLPRLPRHGGASGMRDFLARPGFYGKMPPPNVEYHINQYDLEQGALEIQYIEEFFGEFPRKKTASEIVRRLSGRSHLILLANAPLA